MGLIAGSPFVPKRNSSFLIGFCKLIYVFTSYSLRFKSFIENKICGKVLGPVSAPIFRLRKRYRVRLLIRGPKTLKMQNSLAITIPKFKFLSGIKLSVDVDPINFN